MAIANYHNFNAVGLGVVGCLVGFLFCFYCCHFANDHKLSSLEADHLRVKMTFVKEKISLLGFFYLFFWQTVHFFHPCWIPCNIFSFNYHRTLFNVQIISQSFGVGGLVTTIVVSLHGAGRVVLHAKGPSLGQRSCLQWFSRRDTDMWLGNISKAGREKCLQKLLPQCSWAVDQTDELLGVWCVFPQKRLSAKVSDSI